MASSLPPHATREDIEEELDFTDVLIQSLDAGADDYDTRLAQLDEKKAELEARLDALSNGGGVGGSRSRADEAAMYRDPSERERYSPQSNGNHQNGIPSMDGSLDHMYAGMKRPAAGALRPDSGHPSKRPTPDPSNAPTPASSVESLQLSDNSSERARLRQLVAAAAYRRQHEAQMADERLARQLSQEHAMTPSAPLSSTLRPAVQTTLNQNGSYQRPPPPQTLEPQRHSHDSGQSHGIPPSQRQAYDQYLSRTVLTPDSVAGRTLSPYIKSEPAYSRPPQLKQEQSPATPSQSARSHRATEIIDLTASDDEEDVTEIDRTRFTPNGRAPRPTLASTAGPSFGSPLALRGNQQPQFGRNMPGAWPTGLENGYQSVYSSGNSIGLNNGSAHANGTYGRPRTFAGTGNLTELNFLVNGANALGTPAIDDDDDLHRRRYNEIVDTNPEKTREEINALLENIRPDEEIPAHLRVQTPEAMSIKLHKYQELGLTWLKTCEEGSNKGGILADEMGLGKTIQMLGLIVTRKSNDFLCKTTLIIAPVALMRQWKQEIEQKIKGRHRLTVFIQHGQQKKKSFHDLRQYDIVLSTYGTLAAELKKLEKFRLRQKFDPTARPNSKEQCALLGEDANWYRVILDEAQCIKNRTTRTAQAACFLNAKYRFCMTGTPMMNNVGEFYSLLKFLRINPYSRWEKFRLDIAMALDSKNADPEGRSYQAAMEKLRTLCKATMLRRTKQSTFEGEPILVLPEIVREVDHPEFSQDERDFYSALEGKIVLQFNRYRQRGEVWRNYSAILVLLLRLRQAACHPHLIKDFSIAGAADLTEEAVLDFAKALEPAVVARIKATNGSFECPVCYDVVEIPAIFIPCGHDTCRECFSRITDPSNAIRDGNEGGVAQAKCPNCRALIDPKKVTDFDAFKKVHMRELLTPEELQELEGKEGESEGDDGDEDTDSNDDSDDDDDDDVDEDEVDKNGDLKDFIVNDDEEEEDGDDEPEEGVAGPSTNRKQSKATKGKGKKGKGRKEKGKKKSKKEVSLADLAKLSHRNLKARKRYLRRLRETYVDSAKISATMELLQRIMNDPEGEKVLVFSQWTSLLDLVEIPIDGKGWEYRRYDGSMNAKMRADAVDDFRDHRKNVRIMLVSLKAGNAGLNLTAASQVIILDPFWNPYIEEQAIDRAHRIGQEREVKVHRMLIQDTIEDRIVAIQENKRAIINQALDEKEGQRVSRLGIQELAYLFGVTSNPSESVDYQPRSRR